MFGGVSDVYGKNFLGVMLYFGLLVWNKNKICCKNL